jgi:hypothetical protein
MSSADIIAVMKMRQAEDDDAEVCLDSIGESRNGDEFELMPLPVEHELHTEHVEPDAELCTLLDGFDDLMITYADQRMIDDPVWAQMKAQRQAILEMI